MAKKAEKSADNKITFHYIKSPNIVDLPVSGAYGGIVVETGRLYMAVFSERSPIPQEVDVVSQEGSPIAVEAGKRGKEGVIRSVNAVMHFDINTALSLRDWLNDKIQTFERAHPEVFKAGQK